ncbi:MAG: hypothetical protein ACXWSD_04110 [Bdellovibrionota bacterium]
MKFVQLKKYVSTGVAVAMALTLTACGGSSTGTNPLISGVTGPDVEVVNGRLVLSMVFNDIHIDGGATIPIPKYPNSSIQVGPDFQSAGTLLVLTISVSDFLGDKGTLFNTQTLPGGRPLPGIAAGVIPAVAIQVPQLANMVFYVGPQVLGVFVPFGKLNLQGAIVSFRFYNKAGAPVGMISLVGSDAAGANAGILALVDANLAGILKPLTAAQTAALAKLVP